MSDQFYDDFYDVFNIFFMIIFFFSIGAFNTCVLNFHFVSITFNQERHETYYNNTTQECFYLLKQ